MYNQYGMTEQDQVHYDMKGDYSHDDYDYNDRGDSRADSSAEEEYNDLLERHGTYELAAEEKGYADINSWNDLWESILYDWNEYWDND